MIAHDTTRLHKALAKHKMDEEIRKQKSREEEKTIEDAISRNLRGKREFDRTIDNDIGVRLVFCCVFVSLFCSLN